MTKIPISSASGLETVLEKVGRSLSEHFGIRVVCQGARCCTDGRTIFLPAIPDELPPAMLQIIRGYLDHEAGHLLGKSNFRIIKWFREKHGVHASHFLNMLEDLRVEEVMRRRFPGSGKNLDAAYNYLVEEVGKSADPMPAWWQLAFGTHARGNRLPDPPFVGQEVSQALDMISDAVLKAPHCRNTAAAARLAEEAWPFVSHLFPPPPDAVPAGTPAAAQGQPGGQSGQNGSGCGTQSSGQANAGGGEDGANDNAGAGNDDARKGAAESGQAAEQARAGASREPAGAQSGNTPSIQTNENLDGDQDDAKGNAEDASEPGTDDVQDEALPGQTALAEPPQSDDAPASASAGAQNGTAQTGTDAQDDAAATDIMRDLAGAITSMVNKYAQTAKAYRVWTTEFDIVRTARNNSPVPHHQRMAALLPHVAGVRRKLLQTLLAEPKARWLGDREAGNINPRALHRLAVSKAESSGNARIFRERVRTKRLHTAVTLLVDQSASMGGWRIKLASDTALVFCEALSKLDIPCSVIGFTATMLNPYQRDTEARTGMTYGQLVNAYRVAPLVHTYFKRFHESFRAVSGRFDAMRARDVTPLGESILFAARELACRREERKVLFVLTDGQPEVGLGDDSATFRHAKDSVRRVERAGIDVALVGILTDCVTALHHNSVVVNSLEELPKTVMRQLQAPPSACRRTASHRMPASTSRGARRRIFEVPAPASAGPPVS